MTAVMGRGWLADKDKMTDEEKKMMGEANLIHKNDIMEKILSRQKRSLNEELEEYDSLDGHISNAKRVFTAKNMRII